MDMKIQILSEETIKPSSPNHPTTHSFTILDQFILATAKFHVPLLLFYSNTSTKSAQISLKLKNSLEQTLSLFYPLAGRIKDDSCIDCNDAGAIFIETSVSENIHEVLKEPKVEVLKQLLPINPYQNWIRFSVPELVLIQVNHFSCGGVAIGLCISHVIADAITVATFVNIWAAIARGDGYDADGVITDCTSLFPPVDPQKLSFSSLHDFIDREVMLKDVVSKRFVFDGEKIAALRRKIGSITPSSDLPTRFEALSALITGILLSLKEKTGDHAAYVSVNLRKRMNPPLPPQCIGNVIQIARVGSLNYENGANYKDIAGKFREAVRGINDENMKRFHEAGGMLSFLKSTREKVEKSNASEAARVAVFGSWCDLPFYEGDFGWGKPSWVGTTIGHDRLATFLDSRDGKGIEVWLGLHSEVMSQFEQNPDIIEYASFVPSK